jgi:hypothetical protein
MKVNVREEECEWDERSRRSRKTRRSGEEKGKSMEGSRLKFLVIDLDVGRLDHSWNTQGSFPLLLLTGRLLLRFVDEESVGIFARKLLHRDCKRKRMREERQLCS